MAIIQEFNMSVKHSYCFSYNEYYTSLTLDSSLTLGPKAITIKLGVYHTRGVTKKNPIN